MKRALMALLALSCCCEALAQSSSRFAISHGVVASGGATFSSSSRFQLGSTIAQPLAAVLASSRFSIRGGFWTWPAPFLFTPVKMGTNVIISFQTEPGKRYTVGYSDSLTAPSWQSLPSFIGDGSTKSVTNAVPDAGRRFYQLLEQ